MICKAVESTTSTRSPHGYPSFSEEKPHQLRYRPSTVWASFSSLNSSLAPGPLRQVQPQCPPPPPPAVPQIRHGSQDASGSLHFHLQLSTWDHTANSSTASGLDSKVALSACLRLENTNLPSMTFGLASALLFTVTTHHHLLRCLCTCLYFVSPSKQNASLVCAEKTYLNFLNLGAFCLIF